MSKVTSFSVSIVGLILCTLTLIRCAKEYSYEGGPQASGSAVYTLVGAGGICTSSVIAGDYFAGTALNTGNTIQLHVHVTSVGTYTLSSNSTNGMVFATSGSFTDTGFQSITLLGSGTPTADGSFDVLVKGGEGCTVTIRVNKAQVPQANYALVGDPNSCGILFNSGTYIAGKATDNSNYVTVNVKVTGTGPYSISTDTLDGIFFSASGTFTSTGTHSVNLMASGTPDLPRNLVFTPKGTGTSCTFKIAVQIVNPAAYVLESGSVGATNQCIYNVLGTYTANTPLSLSNTVSMHVYVANLGNFAVATNTVNGMSFSVTGTFTTQNGQWITLTGIGTPISPGTYTFTPEIIGPAPLGGQACSFDITVQ
ncbi:MAG: hypothetical protein C5B59_13420 [Bacteroidetes bacterium]|nr:MAG: hypothetical protein C5B59_13420 [Bacteroidota bacterium]